MITILIEAYRFSKKELLYMKKLEILFDANGYGFDRWPEVYFDLSETCKKEEIWKKEDNIDDERERLSEIDYLGIYRSKSGAEGTITLFRERINNCSKRIANKLRKNEIEVTEALKFIVLIHELGHWFTHWCHKKKQKARAKSFGMQPKYIIETMAQLSVEWAMIDSDDKFISYVKEIFDFLVDRQPKDYQYFYNLKNEFNNVGKILSKYEEILDFKETGIQSGHKQNALVNNFINGALASIATSPPAVADVSKEDLLAELGVHMVMNKYKKKYEQHYQLSLLGYSAEDISTITGNPLPSIKRDIWKATKERK